MSRPDGRSGMLPCSLLIQVVEPVEIFDNDNDDDDDDDGDNDDNDEEEDDKTVLFLFFKIFSSARALDR